ncbi:MAG: hypothetical protein ACUVS2_02210 [Candidatus Flexifilum sp.]|jgi:hypothetical protein
MNPEMEQEAADDSAERIDRLLDAIELIRAERRSEARAILRALIRADGDFEEAWLWMSVAVDHLDQAAVCLDNVLRINPRNVNAAAALYRIRVRDLAMERRRRRLRGARDLAFAAFWLVVVVVLCAVLTSGSLQFAIGSID